MYALCLLFIRKALALLFVLQISFSFIFAELPTEDRSLLQLYALSFKSGNSSIKKGDYSKAIDSFKECLKLAFELDNKEKHIQCLSLLGLLYWNIGKLEESSGYYKDALALAKQHGLKNQQEECKIALEVFDFYSQGKKYRTSGQYWESIEVFKKAINLARKFGSKEHELKCLRQLSISYWELDKISEFHSLNKQALGIAQKLNHRKEIGRCFNNIGNYYKKSGDYSYALSCYSKALNIAQEFESKRDESERLNNIGIVYKDMGDFNK